MPILNGDIKLVASQVMNDVAEGGGAPTSIVITDGASNAIFPDISELDRAGGRVNLRKLHVTVQTDEHGYFVAVLAAGKYSIGSGPFTAEISVDRGITTLVPLRAGKRMVD